MKKHPLEVLFSIILNSDLANGLKVYSNIEQEWIIDSFHKHIYQSIGELLSENNAPDLIQVMNKFRDHGWFNQNTMLKLSDLISQQSIFDSVVGINSIYNELRLDHATRKAIALKNQLEIMIQSENLTLDKYNNLLKESELHFQIKKDFSNTELVDQIFVDHDNAMSGKLAGTELGYFSLQGSILLEPVDLMVIGARPAMGKTAFAVSTAVQKAKQGEHVLLFALEMTSKQVMRRIVANITEIDSNRIKYGRCSDAELLRIVATKESELLQRIHIIEGSKKVSDIAALVAEYKVKFGITVFIVDYLQKILPTKTRSRYEAVSEISNSVKLISQNMHIPCIAFAQLSRSTVDRGGDMRPRLSDLKESGEIEQDASIVAFLHRPEYYGHNENESGESTTGMAEFIIAKNREGETGIFNMNVDLKTSKFQ